VNNSCVCVSYPQPGKYPNAGITYNIMIVVFFEMVNRTDLRITGKIFLQPGFPGIDK